MGHTISTTPLAGGLGVEIHGLTHEAIADAGVRAEIGKLLEQHSLIKASIDDFSEEEQELLANSIGLVMDDRFGPNFKPGTVYISNTREDGVLGKGAIGFHHDHLYHDPTLRFIMLYAIEIPASGSETRFRSAASLLEALPAELRARAEAVECLHLYDYKKIREREYRDWDDVESSTPDAPRAYKPFVWRNPDTGVEALLVSQSAIDFKGIDREAGIALYEELSEFAEQNIDGIATYDLDWKPGDLVIWDNRMVAHARESFAKDEPRTIRRSPIL